MEARVGDIKFVRLLGEGTFGKVYMAEIQGSVFAVKVVSKRRIVEMKQRTQVIREREILLGNTHPFMVRGYSTLQCRANLYIVMEYVPGGELFDLLGRVTMLPSFAVMFYAAEIILLFSFLHSRSLVYRDLKPENILFDADGHIKVVDFGFSKRVTEMTYTLCGTPEYLAPELILSKGYGKSIDWYMLGVVAYEMLTGGPPFSGASRGELYRKIVCGEASFPEYIDPDAVDFISKLLIKDPLKRLGSGHDAVKEMKSHRWFSGLDWSLLETKRLRPPYKPEPPQPAHGVDIEGVFTEEQGGDEIWFDEFA
ncbi:MAG: AGC/PKA protein kinase [Amphiamblys sp. WSBS2006]|nr:MAG: AGC/PKA protein kinase [Amphiamblys sp. WSBS2006]